MTQIAPPAPLYLVRGQVDLKELCFWMSTRRTDDYDYAMHSLLSECFGELRLQPFSFTDQKGAPANYLYAYSEADERMLRENFEIYADPLQSRVISHDRIYSKEMPTQWQTGKRLTYQVKVWPTVRKNQKKGAPAREIDAYTALQPKGQEVPRTITRPEAYTEWLAREMTKQDEAAELNRNSTKLVYFRASQSLRQKNGRTNYAEGPTAIMTGSLTIKNPEAFNALLKRGIGRHRAYGFGMLLLKPDGNK